MKNQYAVPLAELPIPVQEFAAYKSGIQNCSEKTVSEYLLDLRTFFRYLIAEGDASLLYDNEKFREITVESIGLD